MTLAGWTPRARPGQGVLTGRRTVLEPLDWGNHGDGLFGAVCGPQNVAIWDYMPIGPFSDLAAFRQSLDLLRQQSGWDVMVFRRRVDAAIVGMASYMRLRPEHGSVEVGCVAFGPELKRSLEASEGMFLMASHVFEELGYRRYEWKCNERNDASKRAAERFGFVYEGLFRNDMVVKGNSRNTAWYAMTDGDWARIRPGFERWLSPDNFDGHGQQKQTLKALRG